MQEYLDQLRYVLEHGEKKEDRTGTGTLSVFGMQQRYDLQKGFPIVTTKKIFWRGIVEEFLWMVVRGSTDVTELEDRKVMFWSEWKGDDGTIGPGYGKQFRSWPSSDGSTIDQVAQLIEGLKTDPTSRRHLISLWNVADLPDMALPPCHGIVIQFYVRPIPDHKLLVMFDKARKEGVAQNLVAIREDAPLREKANSLYRIPTNYLDCQMYQRSGDMFLGVPFNISFYALFTHVIAQLVGMEPGHLIHTLGDAHIYRNHLDQVKEQLTREPLPLPMLKLNPEITCIDDFTIDDIELVGYNHHPAIKGDVAV